MANKPHNVLLPMSLPTQRTLRGAVANIIRDIQRDAGETDQDTADRIGISIGTIRNARNETTDLNALTIARIGAIYGAGYLDPYNALYGATARRVANDSIDPLAHMAKAVSTICDMRNPASHGGALETTKEQLDALPTLREARKALESYIAAIEGKRMGLVA